MVSCIMLFPFDLQICHAHPITPVAPPAAPPPPPPPPLPPPQLPPSECTQMRLNQLTVSQPRHALSPFSTTSPNLSQFVPSALTNDSSTFGPMISTLAANTTSHEIMRE